MVVDDVWLLSRVWLLPRAAVVWAGETRLRWGEETWVD
jgi:hypothetical protein